MSDGQGPAPPGLALVGYRGTGKSTVGRRVARNLGWEFADADLVLEARAGLSIAEIFQESGEAAFRDLEAEVLRELTVLRRLVLATGGGAILSDENRRRLRAFGKVVWLTANPDTLIARLRASVARRPALTAAGTLDEVADVLAARAPLYEAVSDVAIATDGKTSAEVAQEVTAYFLAVRGSPS
jgi:shikimate kinase